MMTNLFSISLLSATIANFDFRFETAIHEKHAMSLPKTIQDSRRREIHQLAYSADLQLLAYAPAIYSFPRGERPVFPVILWDLQSGAQKTTLATQGQRIEYLAFSAKGTKLVSGALNGVVVWDTLKAIVSRDTYQDLKTSAILTPSEKELLNSDAEGNVATWDAQTGLKRRVITVPKDAKKGIKYVQELSCSISSDEKWIVLGGGLANHRLLIVNNKKDRFEAALKHQSQLSWLIFSHDSRFLFGGGNEVRKGFLGRGVLSIWETQSWKLACEVEVDDWEVRPIAYIHKESIVITVNCLRSPEKGNKNRFRTFINGYSVKTGQRLVSFDTQLPKDGSCCSALYLGERNTICIGGMDGKITFFLLDEIMRHRDPK